MELGKETQGNLNKEAKESLTEEDSSPHDKSLKVNKNIQDNENTQQQDNKSDNNEESQPTSNLKPTISQEAQPLNAFSDNNNSSNDETENDNNNVIDASQMFVQGGPRTLESELFENVEDGFVMVDADNQFKFDKHRQSFYNQMETILSRQINQCEYYKKFFEKQNNVTMANKFAAHSLNSTSNLDLLKLSWKNNEMLPKYKFEHINFSCVPVNAYIRDKEVQITVKASNLPVEKGAVVYIIGEFSFPHSKDEPLTETITRWFRYSSIDPKNIVSCCTNADPRQLDSIYSIDSVPFYDPESKYIMFDRPLSFFVEKGKSRTLKRKFKLVKLTFFEKKNILSFDERIGTVQLKIDGINDEISLVTRQHIMDGRRQTGATVDLRVRVREALVNRSIRAHEEKLLLLT